MIGNSVRDMLRIQNHEATSESSVYDECGLRTRPNAGDFMKIGELAAATQTSVETIRYYEREGLLTAPMRNASNYRVYQSEHLQRLNFIRHCRALDMALPEIRVLLEFKDRPASDCGEVNALLEAHIGHVSTRIRELRQLERQLQDLRARCTVPDAAADCGILKRLAEEPTAHRARASRTDKHVGGTHGH